MSSTNHRLKCPSCGSIKNTETITGGITVKIYRKGEYTMKDEIIYDETDRHSKWECTDCHYKFKEEEMG